MVDLEDFEMADLSMSDGFDFESGDLEGGEFEAAFDFEGGEFEDYEAIENYEDMEGWATSYEDMEADPFLGNLVKSASKALSRVVPGGVSPQFLQNLAGQAARVAGGAIAGKTGANIAGQIANTVLREGDDEDLFESDLAFESLPIDQEILDEMDYYAYQAAEAASEPEADQFIGSLVGPLVSGLLSGETDLYEDFEGGYDMEGDEFLPALLPLAMPLISQGVGAIGKMLTKNKRTRKFTRALPKIMKESVLEVQNLRRPPTRRDVARVVGRQTARTLGNRRAVATTFRQNRAGAARAQARPAPVRSTRGPGFRPMPPRPTSRPGRPPYGPSSYPRATYGTPIYAPPSYSARAQPPYGRRRGRVVGYILKPIYSRSRS